MSDDKKKKFVLKKQNLETLTRADFEWVGGSLPRLDRDVPRNPWTPGTSTCAT